MYCSELLDTTALEHLLNMCIRQIQFDLISYNLWGRGGVEMEMERGVKRRERGEDRVGCSQNYFSGLGMHCE